MAGLFDDLIPSGGNPATGLSNSEREELSKARVENRDGRPVFDALAQTYRVASRYPGGIPETVKDKGFLAFGSDGEKAQDFDLFNKYNIRASAAKAKLLGVNPTDTDLKLTLQSVATPQSRFGVNQQLIGDDYKQSAQKYFENAFKQRWAAEAGGLNGRDARGMSYPQALAEAFRRPEVSRLVTPPWERIPGGPVAPKKSGWKVRR